nr:MAG TPA: hypothetical protein [Bacteriophage sp.]
MLPPLLNFQKGEEAFLFSPHSHWQKCETVSHNYNQNLMNY